MSYKIAGLVLSAQSETSSANGKIFVRVMIRALLTGPAKEAYLEVSPNNTAESVEIGGMIWQELFVANDKRMPRVGDIEVWDVDFSLYQEKPQIKIYGYLPAEKDSAEYSELLKKLTPQARTNPKEVVVLFEGFFKPSTGNGGDGLPARVANDFAMDKLMDSFLAELKVTGKYEAFLQVPAGEKVHHSTSGGLVEHIWQMVMMVLAQRKAHEALFPELVVDWPVVVMAVVLHDAGKIHEYDPTTLKWAPTPEGHLLTHLPWGALFVERCFPDVGDAIRKYKLQHCLLSHHGKDLSPVAPLTPEAVILNLVDLMSANMDIIRRTKENPALGYNRLLGGTPFVG